jgi:hypothetical protein
MANIYDVEGIEEFLPEQKKPLSSFLGDYATTANEVASPYIGMAGKYGFGNDPAKIQGLGSDVRHTTGSALGKFGIQDYFSQFGLQPSNPISNFLGNAGIAGSTVAQEIGDAIRGFRQAGLEGAINQPMEDVNANFRAMGIPYGTSLEDIVNMSVEGSPSAYMANAPEEIKISRFNAPGPFNYGAAQASDLTNLEKDFPGMSTGDIIDSMNNRAFIGRQISPMAKPNVVDPNRIPGRIQEAVEPRQGILQGFKNSIGSGLGSIKDFAIDKGTMGRNLLGSAGAMALGLPGIIGSLLSNLGDGVDYQQYTPGFDYKNLNPSMINDFYNPKTGLNRFDRARKKGNTFASSRTLAEYFEKRKVKKAAEAQAKQAAREAATAARAMAKNPQVYSNAGITSGGFASQNTGTEASFSNKTGRGRTGYSEGGVASMFTRRG